MTKPGERVAELDRQIAEIDAEISEFRKKAASVQANLEDKLSALRQKLQESDHLKQKLTREREAADAAAIEFLDVARELDKAETVEGLHKLGKLAATLAFAGRLTQTRYEARRLSMDRMRKAWRWPNVQATVH